ncbi:MAG TPA: methyltransferase domain-containing protein [Kofleriaceae bacterium]|nr:methyltransferase domain-containing protein [Kofleriaceae bacterium]
MAEGDRRRWDARWREGGVIGAPSPLITALDELLPRSGRALDVAGGPGRHALWLARRGLEVTLVDVSPVALERAAAAAREAGLRLTTAEVDLDRAAPPAGPWDLVLQVHYVNRALTRRLAGELAPGGLLVLLHPTRTNLERHERPSARFLLDDGEAAALAGPLDILRLDEGWLADGRHEALLVARRPA